MDGFTLIDGIAAAVILLSAILAYSRGFVREALAIAGWVGAAVLAFMFAGAAQPLVKEIPVINKIIGENCEVSMITAFAVVFAVGLIVASLFTPLFSSVIRRSFLSGIDQGLGFVFGAVRGIALVGAAFLIYAMTHQSVAMVDNSRAKTVFDNFNGGIQAALPDDLLAMITMRYNDLTASCRPTTAPPAAETATPSITN
ncbi:MAG: hypothetical protein RIR04_679 [Pseudomonadota bacterium]